MSWEFEKIFGGFARVPWGFWVFQRSLKVYHGLSGAFRAVRKGFPGDLGFIKEVSGDY